MLSFYYEIDTTFILLQLEYNKRMYATIKRSTVKACILYTVQQKQNLKYSEHVDAATSILSFYEF